MSMWHIDKGLNHFEIYNDIFACWDVLNINLKFDYNHKHNFQMNEVVNQVWGSVQGNLPLLEKDDFLDTLILLFLDLHKNG